MYDTLIIGSGPAGMTAALYAAHSNLKVGLLERGIYGGQMNNTAEIENYPGYEMISGPELAEKMYEPLDKFRVEHLFGQVVEVQVEGPVKKIITEDGSFEAKSVILAMGAQHPTTCRRSLGCWWRHSGWAPDPVGRAFDQAAFDRIEAAISQGENLHRGELRFAIESRLGWPALRRGLSARERALQVFGEQRVWDTEENTGVLIYLLTADHAVEIIADRLVNQRLPADIWPQACQRIVGAGPDGPGLVDGVISAIELINQALIEALPATPGARNPNELENRPIRL